MKDLFNKERKMALDYLMPEYPEDEALEQIVNSNIEKKEVYIITYDNGKKDYVEVEKGKFIAFKS